MWNNSAGKTLQHNLSSNREIEILAEFNTHKQGAQVGRENHSVPLPLRLHPATARRNEDGSQALHKTHPFRSRSPLTPHSPGIRKQACVTRSAGVREVLVACLHLDVLAVQPTMR